ncbi:hypothetical protein DCCM_0164 [Desulfocucumis palustris]|uniref:Uncharacterized protein n=1 Tax=Desulfocucumis palustris TaxID=1898651 RepID=A0A2L2X7T9_9FIRM|nr:hypothetical protein DCCM_0164 [Desulfocucumis palustris]
MSRDIKNLFQSVNPKPSKPGYLNFQNIKGFTLKASNTNLKKEEGYRHGLPEHYI